MDEKKRKEYLSGLCLSNLEALVRAFDFCLHNGIGDFRVNSQIFPLYTHPEAGYVLEDLPNAEKIFAAAERCRRFAGEHDLRITFHPDQFNVLSSPSEDVLRRTVEELSYQARACGMLGGDVVNVHGGGMYGDKPAALLRLIKNIGSLPEEVRCLLTLENDDRTYTPEDLLPVCRKTGVPLVYDVHHHRCNPDTLSVEEATEKAAATWKGRPAKADGILREEPLVHISSPKFGWGGKDKQKHRDFIDPADFPDCWLPMDITVEVEAKAKELAVLRLIRSTWLPAAG
jgi:UV DNA damage endonuclease